MSQRLEGSEVVFGLLVAGHKGGNVEAEAFQTGFGFMVFTDFGTVSGQNWGAFDGLVLHGG